MSLQTLSRSALRTTTTTTTTTSTTTSTTTPRLTALSRPFKPTHTHLTRLTSITAAAPFSTTKKLPGGHESHYDPPSGWLFGVPPGQKYEKEGWENVWFYGFFGSFLVAGVAFAFKPDTSIQTWALEEARRRLEAEGILEDPERKA
ncbi:hypothetical protein EJ05DRAFT_488169 [Pseudovirgaria hyperparasitica]|uniref:NADH dehydrogenase [ubiquinone] 1 beta subcomplex subunit 11, mitochondrial n=1 Tax=Pseudovirgaria hyperparasitica TaxID=470096 RepID=A0A6A6VYU3_9PEZI|nr:uncharacterized protein EJ05DRAFT_488169 [Pseudovirgaria hyperparasitica]KAF2755395.1 hypothetical protein EJ05DRAFT_488169 [Pseudovirgaria hyperparasitica]